MSDALVIGAGLGGLLCGRILSRKGWNVTILEQGIQAGGALQTFVRCGIRFDTGFHSVGGLAPGEPLDQVFRTLGLRDLPWYQVEADEIVGGTLPFLRLSSGWSEEVEHVADPYQLSVWRLQGGGKTLCDALCEGQKVLLRKRVTSIHDHEVTCADGSSYRADVVVSDIHPLVTMRLLLDPVRRAYTRRLESLANGPGVFTVNIQLRQGEMSPVNHSIFLDDTVMIHFGEADARGFARSVDLMGFEMPGQARHDGEGQDREARAEELIRKAAERLPELPSSIERYWTSTPATWERFTGTPGGSAYGIMKHSRLDYIAPQTPLPWLFLTGQNLGLHGILGTSVTAINTCKSISQ